MGDSAIPWHATLNPLLMLSIDRFVGVTWPLHLVRFHFVDCCQSLLVLFEDLMWQFCAKKAVLGHGWMNRWPAPVPREATSSHTLQQSPCMRHLNFLIAWLWPYHDQSQLTLTNCVLINCGHPASLGLPILGTVFLDQFFTYLQGIHGSIGPKWPGLQDSVMHFGYVIFG